MAQQINLYTPSPSSERGRPSARDAVLALAIALLLAFAAWPVWHALAEPAVADVVPEALTRAQAELVQQRADLAREQAQQDSTLAALRRRQQAWASIHAELNQSTLGPAAGSEAGSYLGYLQALARQADGHLWITAFSVSADGQTLEIRGRTRDASSLPRYLSRLDQEAAFKGRRFAQLQMVTLSAKDAPAEQAPVSEFVLRSTPAKASSTGDAS
jgi:Tfp pilus assembly protein PilN